MPRRSVPATVPAAVAALVLAGAACGSDGTGTAGGGEAPGSLEPDRPAAEAPESTELNEEGNELGVRELVHDHAAEQPFTRSETVQIPGDVDRVTVEGRDQVSGWGGGTVTVEVPRG